MDPEDIDTVLDATEKHMLELLQRYFATAVDIQLGPRRESLSQINRALSELTGTKPGSKRTTGQVIQKRMTYPREDFRW